MFVSLTQSQSVVDKDRGLVFPCPHYCLYSLAQQIEESLSVDLKPKECRVPHIQKSAHSLLLEFCLDFLLCYYEISCLLDGPISVS
jgi:hypothetical protein